MDGIEGLGQLLPRQAVRPRDQGAARTARPLRLEGPDDARRLRRHDRQRQDRPVPRRCSKRRRSTASRRSRSIPRATSEPAARRSPTCGPRISGRGSTRTKRRKGRLAATTSPSSRPSCGRRASPTGARTATRIQRLQRRADFAIYTPGSDAGLPLSMLESFAAPAASRSRRPRALARARRRHGDGPARRCSASTPTRSRAASTSCSRTSSSAPGERARTSTSPALIAQIQTAAVRQDRRARSGVVLPGEGSLRAGDDAQQPARLAGFAAVDGGRAARHRQRLLYTPRRQAARRRSSRSRTSTTPSGCSSSRSC